MMHVFSAGSTRKTLRASLLGLCVAFLITVAPSALHASSITYNLTLTPGAGSLYGGTGSITLNAAPSTSGNSDYTQANGGLLDLSFNIDGQTFTLSGATGSTLVRFLNGDLNDITFAETIGTTPYRFTLHTTAGYAFYYNDGQAASYGTFTASPASPVSPVPEPASLMLLTTGLLGGAATLYRRMAAQTIS
ncbi:MAG TPA: PEP-CTERM sorting domain-containing protein [Edaphobacter sp.]|nr:PEP-CTERM sorting domain-containing protein [Edaphobacter sp.]